MFCVSSCVCEFISCVDNGAGSVLLVGDFAKGSFFIDLVDPKVSDCSA